MGLLLGSCTWLPSEFNLSPLYRQRLDEAGQLLELDFLWPVFHYERTADGGDDFRIRPLYRYVSEPAQEDRPLPAQEHQYLWPLGRIRTDPDQTTNRLFPIWSYTSRPSADGATRESDWYALFPFFWGGSRDDGEENYFGLFPLYLDVPQFLTYDRVLFLLWPLYTRTEKMGRTGHVFIWPLAGFGSGPDGYFWHRLLPLYSYSASADYTNYALLFPIITWGVRNLTGKNPVSHFMVWPLYGRQWGENVSAWTFLWPFFRGSRIGDTVHKLDFLWPIFRFYSDKSENSPLEQWWVWPLIARTITNDQWAWNFLWPLIWIRHYEDPSGTTDQTRVIPFYWNSYTKRDDGSGSDFDQVWPLYRRQSKHDGERPTGGEWHSLAIWPWQLGNATGVRELYGWAWTLAQGKRRGADDVSAELIANLYTTRKRGTRRQTSVPFLFSYDGDDEDGTLRLFQLIPIPWGGTGKPATEERDR